MRASLAKRTRVGMETAQNDEITQLREQVRQEHGLYLRALADFDNYRRRIDREQANVALSGKREIILALLDVLDGFELALKHTEDAPSSLSEGIKAIYRRLLTLLEQQKVEPIRSLGEAFDPRIHEAIDSAPSEQHQPGTVIEEIQRGYRRGDELLRPARVRVAA
jgi:molecular chaperone GrpE